MKLFLSCLLALALGACATIQNPINTTQLAQVESGYGIALSAAVAYLNLPLCRTGTSASLSNICAQRSVIVKLQAAAAKTQGAIVAARNFIKNNPTINVASAVGIAQAALNDFQTVESMYGVH